MLEWVHGYDLIEEVEKLVPLNAVVCPYLPLDANSAILDTSSNGLASGNNIEEAVCHALCEIVERHSLAMWDAATDLARGGRRPA